jgi:hypothetical protein
LAKLLRNLAARSISRGNIAFLLSKALDWSKKSGVQAGFDRRAAGMDIVSVPDLVAL